jgi:hypothetical protein
VSSHNLRKRVWRTGQTTELRATARKLKSKIGERQCMAIRVAGLPISIAHPEAIRTRLLAQDTIGIVPSYASLHRANQHVSTSDDVFDVMHYADLGRYKRRITPFITWEPLSSLKPKDA